MKNTLLSVALVVAATASHANEFETAMQGYLNQQIAGWANDPALVTAIKSQNSTTAGYDQTQIDMLDQTWRVSVGMPNAEIINGVINNPAAIFLRDQLAASGGIITEAFIMDARGLNVAAAVPTSDYWQGDEAKFTQTYPVGAGAVHYGDLELDESTQEVQGQISVAVTDQATGETVGALTVGVSLTALTAQSN